MSDVILFAVIGLGAGAAYAMLALGVVVIYKGSRVLNFAQGAIAMFAAFSYAALTNGGMAKVPALLVTLLGAIVGGVLLSVLVMRPLRNAPLLARSVASLGLLLLLQGAAILLWGSNVFISAPAIFPTDPLTIGGLTFSEDRLYLLGATVLIAVVLWLLYRYTKFGLLTRAAAENERGTAYLGYSPDTLAAANWALGAGLAALGGVLYAPITSFSIPTMSLLIVPALAAALIGGFSSFLLTVAGAVLIGVAQSELTNYWQQVGVVDAVPFVIIILVMALRGSSLPTRGVISEARPPIAPSGLIRPAWMVLVPGIVLILLTTGSPVYQSGITTSMIFVMLALSVVVVTGYVGQASLCQMAFAGLGGFAASHFAEGLGIGFPWSILLAALAVVPVGVVIGLPALRVRGLNLAVVTLGAGFAINSVVFSNGAWIGGISGSSLPAPSIAGFAFDYFNHPVRFGILVLVVTGAWLLAVSNLRRGGTGRRMLAVRSNERSAAASGISVAVTKLQAFSVSAFIAALAGGLLSYQLGAVAYERFDPMASITLVMFVYIAGIASIGGAVLAGLIMSGGVFFVLATELGLSGTWFTTISAAMLILTVMIQPDGVAVAWQQQIRRLIDRVRSARSEQPQVERAV
jgi:ABC-type branched-subunit amino acid transport system permease subunit